MNAPLSLTEDGIARLAHDLGELIDQTPFDPSLWSVVAELVVGSFPGSHVSFQNTDIDRHSLHFNVSYGLDGDYLKTYNTNGPLM